MKKRTKITLRTKIYLTTVGLLALTGILYAANPVPFVSGIPFPTGVAAAPDLLLVSEYCADEIDTVDCNGNFSLFATIPGFGSCREKYMAMAPSQSANAGFTPRDVFVTQGAEVYKATPPGPLALFATLPGCLSGLAEDHNGITFDHFGTYGFDMIVTCSEGNVYRIHGDGTTTQIATLFPGGGGQLEGPAVVPPGFGPHGGEIWVADEVGNAVHTIGLPPTYTVTPNFLHHQSTEAVHVIPSPPCTFCSGGAFFQAEQQLDQLVWQYPLSDFTGLGGNVILVSEFGVDGGDTSLVTFDGTNYVQSSFGPRPPGQNEGASFVDCDVPTATPTPTPTGTPSATPTPTPCALASCTPPYPFVSSNPRTNIGFNESEVLRAFRMSVDANCNPQTLQMFYNDEHAMTLGVRQVQVRDSCGTAITDYPVSTMVGNPSSAIPPIVGSTIQDGDQAGTDVSGRPMFPAMYVTDVTANPGNPLAGDWQYGGTAIPPDATFGTWKGAIRTVDKTRTPNVVTVTPEGDPAPNNWNLGPGSDPVPPGLINQGYGNECRWNISSLNPIPGHQYRLYFMVHDGDQNNAGGDSGQACVFFTMPGTAPTPSPTPTASPTPTPTPTTTPGEIVVINKSFGTFRGLKAIAITFRNLTSMDQVLTGLAITWPQAINGNLTKIQMGGTTIFNTSTGGGSLTTTSLLGTTAQRTMAAGVCATLTFTFANNVSTNPNAYTGSATFDPFGNVPMLP